ncbi:MULTISPECIES: PAS domain-containing protein [Rhizobium/Agrobacterium group]|uniref:PAS domain-containing protein n=1 Tax=Rhizobium/Agrobacterium group TaxID=227290 RepID=UPI001AD9EE1C|nr:MULTISPECIES: PAS domain-containing protein [Rhizobium/Agrobacterium group]MBO9112460.1 PAS domain-containing protein [Agrobacterium sp. S2/73]QXZ75970.1 PAS domain-containing protein [Agrobacterium sp. S7/73]QYA17019.1 PAS domain-containing protein [Rhizobium sp. AB2/73]UEQ85408.1 PAS domain-containing protein [Rhizobium sp. AB2/73]
MRLSSTAEYSAASADEGQHSARPFSGVSSTHFLRLVEERGQIGFWMLDFATNRMTLSAGLYRLLGSDRLTPLCWDDLIMMIHPEDRAAQHDIDAILRAGQPINDEFRIVRPDRTVRWLQYKAEVIIGAEGRPSRAVGLMTDVTVQHAARKSVEEGWHRYKTLVAAVASIEFKALASGEITFSRGWQELTSQTPAESGGWGWLDALHPDDREGAREQWLSCVGARDPYAVDFRVRCREGAYLMFLARAAPMLNQDATVREWIGALVGMAPDQLGADNNSDVRISSLEAAHVRAARALLDWTIDDLAFHAKVSVSSIRRLEREEESSVRDHVRVCVRTAFAKKGISFTVGEDGEIILRFAKNL